MRTTRCQFTMWGDDEAYVRRAGSLGIPLAKAMIGARVGATFTWRRPVGDLEWIARFVPRKSVK